MVRRKAKPKQHYTHGLPRRGVFSLFIWLLERVACAFLDQTQGAETKYQCSSGSFAVFDLKLLYTVLLCYLHSKTRTSLHHLEFKKRIVCLVTKQQCRTRQRVQSYCGFTLFQRSVRTASPFPTITRRTRCFQVGDCAKISVNTTKRRCRPG